MDRRKFISGLGVGILTLGLAGCGVKLQGNNGGTDGNNGGASGDTADKTKPVTASVYDNKKLVIAQGTDPDSLIEKGLSGLGGIGVLVKKGSSVVIKPNYSVPKRPGTEGTTTNPLLLAALVKQCLAAGAKEVKVIDFPFGGPQCLVLSGIKDAVEKAGGKAFDIGKQSDFTEVDSGGVTLRKIMFSKDVLDADVLINFPILKHHAMTKVTMGLKGMMGLVQDRQYFHRTDLHQCIAELTAYRKPDLIILDAIQGITDKGPMGPGTIKAWNQLVFGVDPVAMDVYGANLFGVKPEEIAYITAAAKLGVGEIDTQKITVQKV